MLIAPVRHWSEERVGEWLQGLGLGAYAEAFRSELHLSFLEDRPLTFLGNNISGEILMEMETTALKDIGIKKVGDRVRISTQIKIFRNKEYSKSTRKLSNRVSLTC